MSETKPFDTCSVSKDDVTMDHEDTCLDHVIKTEEVDLEPDYIECNIHVKKEITVKDEQTDNCGSLVDTPNDISSSASMDAHTNIETRNELLSTHSNDNSEIYHSTKIKIEIKPEIVTNDGLEPFGAQEILGDLKTEIKIEKMDESEAAICEEGVKIYVTEASSTAIEPKAGVSKTSDDKNKLKKEPKMYKCNDCSYKSVQIGNFKRHLRSHTGEKPFTCEFCAYKCAEKEILKRHLRKHTGENPYSCEFCEKNFASKANLKGHLRIHTGEKPFSCEFCDYKCRQKSSLTRHMKIHTGEKPYSCNFCDYKSLLKSSMTIHSSVHTGEKPFSCNICGQKYAKKSNLTSHLRTHGEKLFSCNICDYKCYEKTSLTKHLSRHTGERSFQCTDCSAKFKYSNNLNRHIKKFHPS